MGDKKFCFYAYIHFECIKKGSFSSSAMETNLATNALIESTSSKVNTTFTALYASSNSGNFS